MTQKIDRPEFPPFHEFLLDSPLYDAFQRPSSETLQALLYSNGLKMDGHCPGCGRETTYTSEGPLASWSVNSPPIYSGAITLYCARSKNHAMRFWVRVDQHTIQKIGQFPSLADLANDQSKAYRGILDKVDSTEFHRAIGLAAHGVGIGAFVYLRRIFERLIMRRFEEFKASEGWSEADFGPRMSDKIDLLKDHLPPFLVQNAKIYSILSIGIHELSEETCRHFFNVLKSSIIMILEEDKSKKEEILRRKELQMAIMQFAPTESVASNDKE